VTNPRGGDRSHVPTETGGSVCRVSSKRTVDHGELAAESAAGALRTAGSQVGLPTDGAQLIRLGSNAVFRLPGNVIARVARSAEMLENAQKQVDVAGWLEAEHFPAVRALNVRQPIVAEHRVVTFWRSESDEEVYAPIGDVADLIRRLHALVEPKDIQLPSLRPFGMPDDPLPDFSALSRDDAEYLRGRVADARRMFDSLDYELPRGVVHGDANVGNVIMADDGGPVLIDLDSFSIGPREWDLIQNAIFYDRFGWHSADEYEIFVRVYGYDIMGWSGYPDLADMREVAMTAWLSRQAVNSNKSAAEVAKRISTMRTGASRRDWSAY